jgi:hypothetical protein
VVIPSGDDPFSDVPYSGDLYSRAMNAAYVRVKKAIDVVKHPLVWMQYLAQAKDSLKFSSRPLYRLAFRRSARKTFTWNRASAHMADKVCKLLVDTTW